MYFCMIFKSKFIQVLSELISKYVESWDPDVKPLNLQVECCSHDVYMCINYAPQVFDRSPM